MDRIPRKDAEGNAKTQRVFVFTYKRFGEGFVNLVPIAFLGILLSHFHTLCRVTSFTRFVIRLFTRSFTFHLAQIASAGRLQKTKWCRLFTGLITFFSSF